eukprot:713584_1
MAGRIPELGAIIIFALTILTVIIYNFKCWHVVQEGYVGFYYKFGKMMDGMTEPGLHFTFPPPITTNIQVYVRPQVDSVKRVKCGAKDGTNIEFPSIEIGNTLPIEKAHEVIKKYGADYDQFLVFKQVQYVTNGLCSQFTSHEIAIEKFNDMDDHIKKQLEDIQSELSTGLKIGFVRIAKPKLPEHLSDAYQRQAKERALKKAKEEEFKRIQQENLNEEEKVRGVSQRGLLQANKQNEINIAQKKSEQEQAEIANQMNLEAAKTQAAIIRENAKAQADAIKEEAIANEKLLTPAYLQLKKYDALLSNSKLIFGDIPTNVFLNQG